MIIILVRTTLLQPIIISSESMQNALNKGDVLMINKYPFWINTNFLKEEKRASNLKRNDIIVFHNPMQSLIQAKSKLIKRIIGLPGETLKIENSQVFIDDIYSANLKSIFFDKNIPLIDSTIFFPEIKKKTILSGFNAISIPAKGDTISLTPENINIYYKIISEFERNQIEVTENKLIINEIETKNYVIQQDYYFCLGDNRNNSIDSRYWGFVPENYIIGKVLTVIYSNK